MEYFKQVQEFLTSTFIYTNEEKFDEEFRKLFQIFYFFGYYRPNKSTKRLVYGLFVLLFVQVTYTLGSFGEVFEAFNKGDLKRALINVTVTSIISSFAVQNFTFIARQTRVVKLVQNLQSLHEDEDDGFIEVYRRKCCRLVKIYTIYIGISSTAYITLTLFGYKLFKLLVPAFYDKYAEGYLYYPLYFINLAQMCSCISIIVTSDLLHIFCIIRAGANFEVLGNKLRQSTDSESTVENEQKACVKYHWAIIEETKEIQKVFNEYFMSKAYGTIFILTSLLFVLLKFDLREDFAVLLAAFITTGLGLFQFGTLCLFGQWLTTKSVDLLDASYDCKWFDQSKSFKKTLMIFRYVCLREEKLGVVKVDFSHESFSQMMSNSYYYYNNMSPTVEATQRKTI